MMVTVASPVIIGPVAVLGFLDTGGTDEGHSTTVAALIEGGADVNAADENGTTPFQAAEANGYAAIVAALLEAGAKKVEAVKKIKELTLFTAIASGDSAAVNALLETGADVSNTDRFGRTPLHIAAMEVHCEIVIALLNADAEVDAFEYVGATSLYRAVVKGHADIVSTLLKAGANVDAGDKGHD